MTAPRILHGARSEQRVKRTATVQKRRLLRQIGLRAADLDGIALGYLDNWARSPPSRTIAVASASSG